MADTAVHLEERVLPRVPIRHWICSLPWGLRALLGYDRKLCAEVVSAFMAEVDRSLRWRAKRELDLASVADAHTGGVVAVQRTDSALRLNVHFHSLVLDGVYVHEADDPQAPLEFRVLDTPTHADIAEVAARTAARVEKILRAHGRSLDPELGDDMPPELALDEHAHRSPTRPGPPRRSRRRARAIAGGRAHERRRAARQNWIVRSSRPRLRSSCRER
ncbi:MAG: hypothetical protein DYH12_15395 [Sorangiineae bacterium PRO1]|nr:hypothetical protein [Sorangiineae bacterium PRO1]